jgi:hypothetical protein
MEVLMRPHDHFRFLQEEYDNSRLGGTAAMNLDSNTFDNLGAFEERIESAQVMVFDAYVLVIRGDGTTLLVERV